MLKRVGVNAYTLNLLAKYRKLYHTFHVSLLEPYYVRDGHVPSTPIDIDGDEEWEVERILDVYTTRSSRERFLVRWKGFFEVEDTWELVEHLTNVEEALEQFRRRESNIP